MKPRTAIYTIALSLAVSLGMATFGVPSTAQAEIIIMEGENPCPGYSADHTHWDENGGCICDPGWTGPQCGQAGGSDMSPEVGGFPDPQSGGGGNPGGGGKPAKNPYEADGPDIKRMSYKAGRQILPKKCKQANGAFGWLVHRDRDNNVVDTIGYCHFEDRSDRQCFWEGAENNFWTCGNVTARQTLQYERQQQGPRAGSRTKVPRTGKPKPRVPGPRTTTPRQKRR